MEEPLVNRVQKSPIQVVDLSELSPKGQRSLVDIAQWLDQGLVLREQAFRTEIEAMDWSGYIGHYVAIHCSSSAILPAWATLLISSKLAPYAKKVVVGSLEILEHTLFIDAVQNLDLSAFENHPVMLKGCADKNVPENAYVLLLGRLQQVAKKISYGEACAAVPLWKKGK